MIGEGTPVAVVDDVRRSAEIAAYIAEEAGLIPSIISEEDGPFDRPEQLLDHVRSAGCLAVICDHRLSQTQFASFTGAEFVSDLYTIRIPSVLLSTFAAIDDSTSIRLYRARIPSLLSRDRLDADNVLQGLYRCQAELDGETAPERTPRRALVRVVSVSQDEDESVADAIVHTWNPDVAIRFPIKLVEDQQIRDALTKHFPGVLRLFAKVNVACRQESDLFLQEFEFAPEPNIEDLKA